jgi:plastocyanin
MTRSIAALASLIVLTAWTPNEGPVTPHTERGRTPDILEVQMVYNGGTDWRFEPATLEVQPGDVIRFVQSDVSPHNVQFKDIPGNARLGGAMMGPFLVQKGDTYELTIDDRFAPGLYKYVCTPHEVLGMTAEITVGSAR